MAAETGCPKMMGEREKEIPRQGATERGTKDEVLCDALPAAAVTAKEGAGRGVVDCHLRRVTRKEGTGGGGEEDKRVESKQDGMYDCMLDNEGRQW